MAIFDRIIANRYFSEKGKRPLEVCSVCDTKLTTDDDYLVAKAFHRGEAIFETVQCMPCQMDSRAYTSEQSIENLMLYSGRRFNEFIEDPIKRKVYHLQEPTCLITGEELDANASFELYSFHFPDANLGDESFLFIGPTAIDQMSELLSEETRKSWERFLESISPQTPDRILSPLFF